VPLEVKSLRFGKL